MKRRLVAMVLSLAMCFTTVVQAGAAEFGSPDSSEPVAVLENTQDVQEDVFQVQEPSQEIPEEEPDVQEEAAAEDGFSDGEEVITQEEVPDEIPVGGPDAFSAGDTVQEEVLPAESGGITVDAEDWEQFGEYFKLRKTVVAAAQAELSESGKVIPAQVSDETDMQEPETAEDTQADEAAETDTYYTAADGLLKISTVYKDVTHTGYYLFDENGYMVTGQKTVGAGTPGTVLTVDTEYYFTAADTASLYSGCEGESINPCSSDLGQQKRNYWLWTGKTFRFYDEEGKYITVDTLDSMNKAAGTYTGYYKINDDYYCLKSDGTPRTGNIQLTAGGETNLYYFQPAQSAGDIPGKMYHKGWRVITDTKGERWLYYNQGVTNPANIGKRLERGTIATKLDVSIKGDKTYLIDRYGYILKGVMKKAENGYYYCTDSNGVIYREKLVRYNGSRYYFDKNGKRVTWTHSWRKCPGASNRFYYFGSTPGKVVEKTGWQKVLKTDGSYYGWFYFDKNGNHYLNKFTSSGYYFAANGKLAGGVTEVNGKKYLFEPSDATTHRGKMYKNTLVYYKNRWFYATSDGSLKKSGWVKIDGNWYCFEDYKAVTNKFRKKNGVNGYLDSTGKYTTGWVIVSNSSNLVKYIDPDGDGFAKNTSKWINGLLYYFDKNGYRINDLTAMYGGPYYVEVDKTNGVMTVYNAARTVPVKSIRVSVGHSWTPTPSGTYTLRRSLRWQPLMGPSWGQYGTHVEGAGQGGIFVHSIACGSPSSYALPVGEYNKLGNPASHGCIRTCVADAKWVYDNCNGATIRIFNGTYNANEVFKGPLGRRALVPATGSFDPTDPAV